MIRLVVLDNGSYHEESARPSGRRREEITYAFYHVNKPNPSSGALVWVDRCTCSLPGLIVSCWNLVTEPRPAQDSMARLVADISGTWQEI